jgi:hypothetical protein
MTKVQRVIVYGSNVALAGIQASLGKDPGMEVIGHTIAHNQQDLCRLQPDAVIFELEAVPPEFPYTLSKELPGLLLVGIDLETNRVLLWSGEQAIGLTSQDLAQIIHQVNSSAREEKRQKYPTEHFEKGGI